jgi:hypothetical protein
MEETKTISAQDKWTAADQYTRELMLISISCSSPSYYTKTSWKKLPYITRADLDRKTWSV